VNSGRFIRKEKIVNTRYFTRKEAIREIDKSTYLLFTIFLGSSIQFAAYRLYTGLYKDNLDPAATIALFACYFFTAIRFFHGNSIVHAQNILRGGEKNLFRLITDILSVFTSLSIICILGAAIGEVRIFLKLLVLLYIFDIVWGSFSIFFRSTSDNFRKWCVINGVGMVVLLILFLRGNYNVLYITAICTLQFAADYTWCRNFYFGKKDASAGPEITDDDDRQFGRFMKQALQEAREGLDQSGIPIGSVLVKDNEIIARGHNRRVQKNDPTAHAEIECIRNAGRDVELHKCTIYSTLMPCPMCAEAIILANIPIVVAGEDKNFTGARSLLESKGIEVYCLQDQECTDIMRQFIKSNPDLWGEDIGTR